MRRARIAWLSLGLTALAAAPAFAQGPVELSSSPVPENQSWKSYVVGTGEATAKPVRINATSGDVTNAEGLVDPSKGPAKLTYSGTGPAPVIILDYGREVGGLPFFVSSAVAPSGTTTSVTLRAAYSEAREFLWTPGATTLFSPAAAGDRTLKVASTANFVVGDTLTLGGASVKITEVGTQGRATTLSTAAAAGATNLRVASVTGLIPNTAITVGGQTVQVTAVGTQGANGTGLTLAAPLPEAAAAGAAVRYDGTGITLDTPLTAAQAAGANVRSTPGAITGDRVGFNGVGMSGSRAENFTIAAPGRVGNAANLMQGGQRFQTVSLTTPGTLELSSVGIDFRHPNSGAADYQGNFLSSDSKLNKLWYQGAYTNDTNSVPIGAVPGQTIPVILDGAKRDRRPWSGDLDLQNRTSATSIGIGAKGTDYIKGTLHAFGGTQGADGRIFGHIQNWTIWPPSGGFYSTSYSMYHVLSVAGYYHYTADLDFVRAQYEIIRRQLAYNRSLVDPNLGLLITNAGGDGRDWDFYDGGKPGAVTAYNAIYYKALTDAAYLARELGNEADAVLWSGQAADVKARLNATLFDATRGVYKLADRNNGATSGNAIPQDANSEAVMWDIAPESARAGILSWLRSNLWGTFGPQPYSPEANYSTVISPFVTGKEVDARFHAGDTKGAIDLIHLMWDQMTDENGPYYTGTVWEKLNQDGTDVDANASLAHGWGSGPVSSLSHYVAGARPVAAGYKTWIVDPQPGELAWAQATLPTPFGGLSSRWVRGDGTFKLTVAAPAGTSGTVRVPLLGRSRTIAVDGAVVWQDGRSVGGFAGTQRDGAVEFTGVTGTHTFAFGTVTADTPGTVGGTVPATLALTLGTPATFPPFVPGVASDYTATTDAKVLSTAGDATLSVSDPGHLTNGAFSLPQPLRVAFSKSTWTAPVSNDPVTITFRQAIGANDPLRTGTYSRTLTFTLSTTTP
ncbi:hypothetical protein OJ997_13650 [Solirubrobacter phytolaccae]|uniref:Alpha-L-rhamnosidase n=1 Tax=Solirubrobacter phytolaccae TaxID=1404360 RepID=A0A9X3N7L0_9ACTN|nr:alpha-L-rhamnosidase C-terminal domain-containing protein [Solirubrobacter phytolaccae]MDA0181345.1 hypothetical protein [Solirubrobacter phytolaccae]